VWFAEKEGGLNIQIFDLQIILSKLENSNNVGCHSIFLCG
jgi:hypothetical protein